MPLLVRHHLHQRSQKSNVHQEDLHVSERQPGVCHHLSVLRHDLRWWKRPDPFVVRFADYLADIRHNGSESVANTVNPAGRTTADVR